MKIRQRGFNYQKSQGTVQHNQQKKKKLVATIIRKQLCLHQAGKRYPNLKSLLKMGRSLYVLCAIVAYIKSSGNI